MACSARRLPECHVTRLTAMADLTVCSWKKTLLPSSGHTVLISSLVMPSRSLPVRTLRVFTVLHDNGNSESPAPREDEPSRSTHILEKPLYSSQALTSGGLEFMSRVTGPLGFHWDGA